MAREIKVVLDVRLQEFGVKSIGATLAKHEMLAAARWQDSTGAKVAGSSVAANNFLEQQAGVENLWQVTELSRLDEFQAWEKEQYG